MNYCVILAITSVVCSLDAFIARLAVMKETAPIKQQVSLYCDVHLPTSSSLSTDVNHIADCYKRCARYGTTEFFIEFPPAHYHDLIEEIHYGIHRSSWQVLHAHQLLFQLGRHANTLEGAECLDERLCASFLAFFAHAVKRYYYNDARTYGNEIAYALHQEKHVSFSVRDVLVFWKDLVSRLIAHSNAVYAVLKKTDEAWSARITTFREELSKVTVSFDKETTRLADKLDKSWPLFLAECGFRAFYLGNTVLEGFNAVFDREMGELSSVFDFFVSDSFRIMAIDIVFMARILTSQANHLFLCVGLDHADHILSLMASLFYECTYDSLVTLSNGLTFNNMTSLAHGVELLGKPLDKAIVPLPAHVYAYPAVHAQKFKKSGKHCEEKRALTSIHKKYQKRNKKRISY